jgi:hypothetical protein
MEEVVAMYMDGVEAGRFKSVTEAAEKLGIRQSDISAVLRGVQHSAGGLMFMRTKDYELIERNKERLEPVQPSANPNTNIPQENPNHLNLNIVIPPFTVGQFNSEL